MASKIAMRMQTPADSNGNRVDIHPFTTTDEVIVGATTENPTTLTDKLEQMETIYVSDTKPNFPCFWAKPVSR